MGCADAHFVHVDVQQGTRFTIDEEPPEDAYQLAQGGRDRWIYHLEPGLHIVELTDEWGQSHTGSFEIGKPGSGVELITLNVEDDLLEVRKTVSHP